MNPALKKLLCFGGALLLGVLLTLLNGNLGFIFNPLSASAAVFGGAFCLFVFGRPHENQVQGQIGWGLLGLTVGLIAPFAVLITFLA